MEPGAPPFTPPVCPSRPLRGHARFRNPEAEDRGPRARFLLEDNETERVSEKTGGNEKESMIDPKIQGMRAEDTIERCEVIIRSHETITKKVLKLAAFVPKMSVWSNSTRL